jgi:autotransporter-associated beta strand protein
MDKRNVIPNGRTLPRRSKSKFSSWLLLAMLTLPGLQSAHGDSATWKLDPTNGHWNSAANWTPETVPDGPGDIATFDVSNTTVINISQATELERLIFNPDASAFTITTAKDRSLILRGAGIVNLSGAVQNFTMETGGSGLTYAYLFFGTSSAGDNTFYTMPTSAEGGFPDWIGFVENATAGTATLVLEGALKPAGSYGARCFFHDSSTAHEARFILNGGRVSQGDGGSAEFYATSNAGHAILTAQGGQVSGASGGLIRFDNDATAADATLIANGSANGGAGGRILIQTNASGGTARVQVNGNATLEIGCHNPPGMGIGSLQGSGLVALGSNELTVGSNGLDTVFSGTIGVAGSCGGQRGSLKKVGPGRLALTNRNSYKGGTTITEGTLLVNNKGGSGTGTGPVAVDSGTLGGRGSIAGTVTIGSGSSPGAVIAPGGKKDADAAILRIKSPLTFNSDGQYACSFDSSSGTADKIVAVGVTLDPAAQIVLTDSGGGTLALGTIFTIIDNAAATPIAGAFSDLPEGAIITVGDNSFQASYEGGDGNDLTLTVVL